MPNNATLQEKVDAVISSEGEMSLGWFLVWEAFDEEGERVIHYLAPNDLAYWQGLGYLYAAIDALALMLGGADSEDDD